MNNKESAIRCMNEYGSERIPFLFVIDFQMKESIILRLDEIDSTQILFEVNGYRNYSNKTDFNKKVELKKYPVGFDEYRLAFDKVKSNIEFGNTYLLNLTFPTRIEINLSMEEIFYRSVAKYKLLYKNNFVVFSPEIFVRIKNGCIISHPMKGTIDASIENAADKIIKDEKELAEHYTIVDLIRNDLSIVAGEVFVEKFRYIDKLKTNNKELLQVSSKISGKLEENYLSKIGSIVFKLLPAGSVCGAPKNKTVEIINKTENYDRGYYTGIFGCFDGSNLDSCVMIRFIERIDNKLFYKSGGGITAFSDCKSEYEELIDKVYVPII